MSHSGYVRLCAGPADERASSQGCQTHLGVHGTAGGSGSARLSPHLACRPDCRSRYAYPDSVCDHAGRNTIVSFVQALPPRWISPMRLRTNGLARTSMKRFVALVMVRRFHLLGKCKWTETKGAVQLAEPISRPSSESTCLLVSCGSRCYLMMG